MCWGDVKIPMVKGIDRVILARLYSGKYELNMDHWHLCETTHCRAGWAIHLAGEEGYALEERYGTETAAAMIYAASRPEVAVPDFYGTTTAAWEDIVECARKGY